MNTSRRADRPDNTPTNDATEPAAPWQLSGAAWREVLIRTWRENGNDNVALVAAGVAFYGFLAIVPLLAATVLVYGLVAAPETVVGDVRALFDVLPRAAAEVIGGQLVSVVETSDGAKGFGLLVSLVLALYGATKGASAIVTALNVAYEEEEQRGFVALNLRYFAIVGGAVLLALGAVGATTMLALVEGLLPAAPAIVQLFIQLASYLAVGLLTVVAASLLYRYGPSREDARWQWLTAGTLFATLGWLLVTVGFGFYASNFGSYGATYGSLSAIVVLLTWLWLSAYVFLMGAELNSELERQVACDTTTGPARPRGTRGAVVADEVAGAPDADAADDAERDAGGANATTAATAATMRPIVVRRRAAMRTGPGLATALATTGGVWFLARRLPGALSLVAAGAAAAWLSTRGDD